VLIEQRESHSFKMGRLLRRERLLRSRRQLIPFWSPSLQPEETY
jgi:hypothetical protein